MRLDQRSVTNSLVTILLLSLSIPLCAQDPSFSACQPFPSNALYLYNQNPLVQTGDFNRDGLPDFVGLTSNGVTVFLGKGDGTFRQGGTFPAGQTGSITGMAVGDFNNDRKLDLAVTNFNGTVSLLLGNGDGTFQSPKTSPIQSYTGFLAVGDFNHDGKLDLVGVPSDQFNTSIVQVLLGNGDGTFQAPVGYTVNTDPRELAVADFNHDGKLDLAVANAGILENPGHTVSILLGNGDGTFQAKKDFQVGNQPFGITVADLNGDGKIDVATANYLDGTVSVLFGKGDGTFQAGGTYAAGHPLAPYEVAAVQFEAGEKPGLAVATVAGTFILANKGDGTFRPAQGYAPGSFQVVSADFNGDGKADLALGAGLFDTDSGVAVLLGAGNGAFATSTAYVAVPNISAVAAGDFNGDGKPDLVVGSLDGPYYLGIMLGQGKGQFAQPNPLYTVSGSISAIAVGDFNHDGKLDLAVVIQGPPEVQILLGNGDGTFTADKTYKLQGQWPTYVGLADFNGDGKLDIAVTSTGDYGSYGAVSILLGNGDGTFQSAVGYGFDKGAPELYGLAIADFNRDGKLDVAFADNIKSTVRVFLGKGDGTFSAGPETPITSMVEGLAAADFNGDHVVDLALLTNAPAIQILSGKGDGTFQTGATFPALSGWALTAADLNGDDKPDLAVLSSEGLVQFLPGKGDGTFGTGTTTYTGIDSGKRTLALADLNRDGSLDLAAPNYWSGSASVFLNRCQER